MECDGRYMKAYSGSQKSLEIDGVIPIAVIIVVATGLT